MEPAFGAAWATFCDPASAGDAQELYRVSDYLLDDDNGEQARDKQLLTDEENLSIQSPIMYGTLNNINYQPLVSGINDNRQWILTVSDNNNNNNYIYANHQAGTRYFDAIYDIPPFKKGDKVRTPKGNGSVWLVESDIVCVELDSELDTTIVHEFEINEVEKIK